MAFSDKFRGLRKEARQRAKDAASTVAQKADARQPGLVDGVNELTRKASQGYGVVKGATKASRATVEARLGETRAGALLGSHARRAGGQLSQLPVLSLVTDVVNEKNSIVELREMRAQDPTNPLLNLWLAEAIRSSERDMRRYVAARTAIDPSFVLVKEGLRTVGTLGVDSRATVNSQAMLTLAYRWAMDRLARDPHDVVSLDVVARVYLTMGKAPSALKPAKMAALESGSAEANAHAMFTLARIYVALAYPEAASVAARATVTRKCTLGHEIQADLLYLKSIEQRGRMNEYADLRGCVTVEDRLAYYGSYRTLSATAHAIAATQRAKSTQAWDKASEQVRDKSLKALRATRNKADQITSSREWGEARALTVLKWSGEKGYRAWLENNPPPPEVRGSPFERHPALMAVECTRAQLLAEAQRLGVKGASRMNKQALGRAIHESNASLFGVGAPSPTPPNE